MNLAIGSIRIFPKSITCAVEDGVQTCLADYCWSLIKETSTVKTIRIAPNFKRERFFFQPVYFISYHQTERSLFLCGRYGNIILTEIVYFAKVCSMLCFWTCGCCPHLTSLHAPVFSLLIVVKSSGGH